MKEISLWLFFAGFLNSVSWAATSPVPTPSAPQSPQVEAELSIDDIIRLRDPFRRPEDAEVKLDLTELENFPLDKLKVVGIMRGAKKTKALIVAPDGRTHFVSEGVRIGQRRGVVVRISAKGIRVREKLKNALGQDEIEEQDLLLPAKDHS